MKLLLSNKVRIRDMKLNDAGPLAHPNKVPFTCSLFHVDVPSNGSPEGAGGKLIMISSAVCDAYLETFVGMGVNIDFGEGMADHDPRNKVGVITKVYRSMDGMAMAEGYLYGKDFPDVVATIRYYNNLAAEWNDPDYRFGTSIEMEAKVKQSETDENVLDVLEFIGTGAAILFAEAAAYTTTSFAARNKSKGDELDMKPEEVKQIIDDAMKQTNETVASIAASLKSVSEGLASVTTTITDMKAADEQKKQEEKENAELKAAQERAEKAEKELADLKAAAEQNPAGEPQRKTISASQLLAKHGGQAEEGSYTDYATFCASVDKLNLSPSESLRLKMQAKNELKGAN